MSARTSQRASEVRDTERWLRKLALHLARDDEAARDLVQDAFLTAHAISRPDNVPLRPWLARVMYYLHLRHLRAAARRHRREVAETVDVDSGVPGIDESLATRAALAKVRAQMEALHEPYRETMRLLYIEELSAAEVAHRLGVPAATIRKRHQLGLEHMRKHLAEREPNWRKSLAVLWWPRPRTGRWPTRTLWAAGVAAVAVVVVLSVGPGKPPGSTRAVSAVPAGVPRFAPGPDEPVNAGAESEPAPTAAPAPMTCPDLQALVREAAAGSVVTVPPCVYRAKVVIDRPLTLVGAAGATLLGSEVEERFLRTSEGYRVECALEAGAFVGPNLVFVDGVSIAPAASGESPGSRTFTVDAEHHVVLGFAPAGHRIEIARRKQWLSVLANDVTVQGFTMAHANNHQGDGALFVGSRVMRFTLTGSRLSAAQGTVLELRGGDHRVQGNTIEDGGAAGVFVNTGQRIAIIDNTIAGNRRIPLEDAKAGWVAGGIFVHAMRDAATDLLRSDRGEHDGITIAGNRVLANRGTGIWCSACVHARVRANRVEGNWGSGVILFTSFAAQVLDNRLIANGHKLGQPLAALHLDATVGAVVRDNHLENHPIGIVIKPVTRDDGVQADPCRTSGGNDVIGNRIVGTPRDRAVVVTGDSSRAQGEIAPCPNQRIFANDVSSD